MTLTYLPANTAALEVASQLEEHGALVITDVISSTVADQLITEIGTFIDKTPTGKDEFSGYNTQRTGALISRSATCRSLATNDLILGAAHKYLSPFTRKILLHLTQAIKINPDGEEQVAYAEMSAGSVFIYNGSVLHGGSANHSSESRIGVNLTYCLGWLRQEENQYLWCPPDIAKDFDNSLQDLLGYTQGEYALSYYSDPYSKDGGRIRKPE